MSDSQPENTGSPKLPDLFLDRLSRNVSEKPDQLAVSFYGPGPNGGQLQSQYNYQDFADATDTLATELLAKYAGQRVVLVYPPGISFLVAFVACLKASVVAVPVFPPHPARKDTLSLFSTICATAECSTVLTDSSYQHQKQMVAVQERLQVWKKSGSRNLQWPEHLEWIVTDTFLKNHKKKSTTSPPPITDSSQLAFLQFTSGSTSAPKGVQITHSNLAHNLQLIVSQLAADRSTVVVSWLPMYHDMGLIGSFLGCLYCGGTGHYLSPLTFLQRPPIWLEAVARHGGTHLQTPNFALALIARKIGSEDSCCCDWSSVRHVINAAEPVTLAAVEGFARAVPTLDPTVVYPTYGLAEHTVMVCTNGKQRLWVDKQALEVERKVVVVDEKKDSEASTTVLMGCGIPVIDVRIVDTSTEQEVEEDKVGEVWVSSPSKAHGYYGQPELSERDFGAQLDSSPTKYLRTGDLGFLHNKELFICGRIKDLIIVGGRNYYPQDLEMTAEAVGGNHIRPGCSAAFEYRNGDEDAIGLVMELRDVQAHQQQMWDELATRIRGSVQQDHAVGLAVISFLQTRTVPKTSSGKIARAKCKEGFLHESLQEVFRKNFTTPAAAVVPLEIDSASGNGVAATPSSPRIQRDAATVRAMSKEEIKVSLIDDLSKIASVPPDSVDPKTALVSMLDSLSLSQFKGLLEQGYKIQPLSDEYLFRETTTVLKLVEVIKLGNAPDDNGEGGQATGQAATDVAPIGQARGLAGALGCPPGVVCTIQ